jgi:hypothetical protein
MWVVKDNGIFWYFLCLEYPSLLALRLQRGYSLREKSTIIYFVHTVRKNMACSLSELSHLLPAYPYFPPNPNCVLHVTRNVKIIHIEEVLAN